MQTLSIAARTDLHAVATVAARMPEAAGGLPSCAMLIVDGTLAIVGTDIGGRLLLAAGIGIRLCLGAVSTGNSLIDARLRAAATKGQAIRDLMLPANGVGAARMSLALTPMTSFVADDARETSARAVIMVTLVVDRTEESIAAIREVCGLTGAETETLRLIFKGLSTVEAASVLGIAKSTARTHLQRVFAKTDTSRQSELVHFVGTWGQQ